MAHAHYPVSLRQLSLREPIGTKIEMDYCELPALFFPLDRLRKPQLVLERGPQQLAVDLQPAQLDRRCEPKPHSRHRVIVGVKKRLYVLDLQARELCQSRYASAPQTKSGGNSKVTNTFFIQGAPFRLQSAPKKGFGDSHMVLIYRLTRGSYYGDTFTHK